MLHLSHLVVLGAVIVVGGALLAVCEPRILLPTAVRRRLRKLVSRTARHSEWPL